MSALLVVFGALIGATLNLYREGTESIQWFGVGFTFGVAACILVDFAVDWIASRRGNRG